MSSRIISRKNTPLSPSPLPPPPRPKPKHLCETLEMEKNLTQQPRIYTFPTHLACIIFVLTSGFMYTCVMLTFINWYLRNFVFSMTKVLNGQSFPKQNFSSPHISMLLEKPCFSLCVSSSFSHSLFYFKLYKISTDLTPVRTSWLVS